MAARASSIDVRLTRLGRGDGEGVLRAQDLIDALAEQMPEETP